MKGSHDLLGETRCSMAALHPWRPGPAAWRFVLLGELSPRHCVCHSSSCLPVPFSADLHRLCMYVCMYVCMYDCIAVSTRTLTP